MAAAYNPADIRAELAQASGSLLRELTILDRVDSTNQAVQRLPAEERHGHAVVADQQTRGRGRHGRRWFSPPGQNIYLSLGWIFQQSGGKLGQLPLAVAVMAARGMQRAGVGSAGIKWPNDIQIGGRKLAGILVELSNPGADQALAVIGLGVNVRLPADDHSLDAIDQPWTDVCSNLSGPSDGNLRNRLCGILLDELLSGLKRFAADGFSPFAREWSERDVLYNREVQVSSGQERVSGVACGLSHRGGLLVTCQAPSGEMQLREFLAGDVSIRAV